MDDHDTRSEYGISGRFRHYTGDIIDWYRIRGTRARLCLGDVGDVGYLSRVAERSSGFVRCGVEYVTREHRTHGVGILFAVKGWPSLRH